MKITHYTGLTTDLSEQPTEALVWPEFTNCYPTLDVLVLLENKLNDLTYAFKRFISSLEEQADGRGYYEAAVDDSDVTDRYPIELAAGINRSHYRMHRAWQDEHYTDLVTHMRELDQGLREMLEYDNFMEKQPVSVRQAVGT